MGWGPRGLKWATQYRRLDPKPSEEGGGDYRTLHALGGTVASGSQRKRLLAIGTDNIEGRGRLLEDG